MISDKVKAIFSETQVMMLIEDYDRTLKLVFEGITAIDKKIDTVEERLTEKIEIVDSKVMGLSKRLDSVEKRLSDEIAEVRADLAEVKVDVAAHRNSTELHRAAPKRPLKRA